jgi:tetratricopeptide (TPR) repeat protein
VHQASGRGQDADAVYRQAIQAFQEAGNRSAEGWAHNDLGLLAYARKRWDEALQHYRQALALFEEGVGLLKDARSRVEVAELRVQRVLEDAAGDLKVSDLDA